MGKLKWLVACSAITALIGCGSTPVKNDTASNNQSTDLVKQDEQNTLPQDPIFYLDEAKRVYANTGDQHRRNQWIIRAAESYKQQGACLQSEKIVHLSIREFTDPALRNQSQIILAECELSKPATDWQKIAKLQGQINQDISHKNRALRIQYAQFVHLKQWLNAALSLNQIEPTEQQQSEDIWYLLQRLNEQELENALRKHADLSAWLQLSLIVKRFGLQQGQLQTAVAEWQTRFQAHPLSLNLPGEIQQAMQISQLQMQKIAVLLPLSGRLSQQGEAIKQGLLAAYYLKQKSVSSDSQDAFPALHFFDIESKPMSELVAEVSDYDVVIGPLVKDKLAEFSQLAPPELNIIGLNRLDETNLVAEPGIIDTQPIDENQKLALAEQAAPPGIRIYFALSPEDEAVQLANKVFKTGAVSPIVVTQQSGAPMRMANTFLQTWQILTEDNDVSPGLATFTDNKSMRTSLTSLLDVSQSKTRIDQLESITSEKIYSVPRNRRDVDAIVLFASPEQTELLNPIVETSLSPFNDKAVPVYASSRSYSQNFSNNTLRDLRNITFTDMPWMLPDGEHQSLKNEVAEIWPKQDDTLKRLFALGYDAYTLVPFLPGLKALPQVSIKGLTGTLSVDQNGNIIRVLPFGKITENEVILLAMD
ncbi:penicillin-binding protein activator [Aliiglaciecola lipolytica]|uniref:penicillin-binding protein activator n=1 Tax=Aliiglaciecola lipolytica TaxID=477689 RepID=UPI001C091264|nr:penicillin-binding protein activator [Aliiglaciecola lipolytica]MBU2876618.1 penicillin-binding protein activator [Aliiglaciecola lipolytica]